MYAVVGGGIAGLAAAYRLQERGHEVQVFEASDEVGGLAALHETAGQPIEKFYHHLSKSEETIVKLAEELGVGDRIEWRIGENAYYVDGVVHPLDKPWEILAYPHMSLYDKFRLALLTQEVDVRGGIPSFGTYEDLTDFEDVPVDEFLIEHTTRGVYDHFFEPLLDAKFGDRKGDVSAAWLLGRIKFRGERDLLRGEVLGYLDGSFGVLLDALVDAVGRENVTTGARVTNVGFADPRVAGAGSAAVADEGAVAGEGADTDATASDEDLRGPVETVTVETGESEEVREVDGVVVAAMPNVLEALTGYACDIDFQGAVCATVTLEEPLTDTYWLNVADEAPFGALIEHTNFVPPERYGGDHLLYVASYVQSREEANWQDDDEALRERWLDGIADLFPAFDPDEDVREFRVARNPRAAPVYERGYLEKVIPYDLADAVAPGVYYAGMASRAQYPERSLNGGILAGFEAADRVAERAAGAPTDSTVEADAGE
ncbi:NAD(P)/FAD-dependent oxidoreductase [Haloparvum sedimenti]|uniref:NAD(P)/FAD-dependent oxidoreductase n=1 Tax=Haloparvum sedimenti TaxID=1678448 RepID=UPI00071E6993|nr:NAD(P)/FAD-dependent oxidoreductase [Haloparvum sedimenti]